jgi:hypothetical protein
VGMGVMRMMTGVVGMMERGGSLQNCGGWRGNTGRCSLAAAFVLAPGSGQR